MGGEDSFVVMIRGLEVHIRVVDDFMCKTDCNTIHGYSPFLEDKEEHLDEFSAFLRFKLGGSNTKTRLFIPARSDHNSSKFGYVAWGYQVVYIQKELNHEQYLPVEPPEGWDALQNEILLENVTETAALAQNEPCGNMASSLFVKDIVGRGGAAQYSLNPPVLPKDVGEVDLLWCLFPTDQPFSSPLEVQCWLLNRARCGHIG